MQRSIAIISVPIIAIWSIIRVLAATAMYAASIALDDKPAYAKGNPGYDRCNHPGNKPPSNHPPCIT